MADLTSVLDGLHFDELSKLRVLDVEKFTDTQQLKEEAKEFTERVEQFQMVIGNFIKIMGQMGADVETEKLKAIGSRNLLKSLAKQRDVERLQVQAQIAELQTQLERLQVEHQSLLKVQAEQEQLMSSFAQ